jgi:hypothetical protein
MAAAAPLRCQPFRLHKHGHRADEYEDALAADAERGRFAVADGATESAFAALWAGLLAESFIAARRPWDLSAWLAEARRRWSAEVMGRELPWYAEMKRAEGAFATLLGLSVARPSAEPPWRWRAVAVGDSCLVRVRKGRHVQAFPLRTSAEFGNQPDLIGSRDGPIPRPLQCSGSIKPGDRFFLMTDALAQWFLSSHENGGRPWEAIVALLAAARPDDAFAGWIEELRAAGGLRNDDVTLLVLEPLPEPGNSPTE